MPFARDIGLPIDVLTHPRITQAEMQRRTSVGESLPAATGKARLARQGGLAQQLVRAFPGPGAADESGPHDPDAGHLHLARAV
jgi:hypothetical protein